MLLELDQHFFQFYEGKHVRLKCKREASAPTLSEFVDVLRRFEKFGSKIRDLRIVTDDVHIQEEIKLSGITAYNIIDPEPSPTRIPDKVCYFISLDTSALTCK